MSNYVKATNFTVKDTLPTGNASKIVRGAEIDDELTAIASAISSKADSVSPALTGIPTAPTATAGTNTTQIATTAFATNTLQLAYPVGSIYMNATTSQNPSMLFGFGTWTAFGAGRMPVGFNAADSLFDTVEETGGSKDAIVVSHTHTATSSVTDPSHTHSTQMYVGGVTGTVLPATSTEYGTSGISTTNSSTTGITVTTTNATTGSSGTNANLPPYITVYMWKRTA
jgi:hypothetical protein